MDFLDYTDVSMEYRGSMVKQNPKIMQRNFSYGKVFFIFSGGWPFEVD